MRAHESSWRSDASDGYNCYDIINFRSRLAEAEENPSMMNWGHLYGWGKVSDKMILEIFVIQYNIAFRKVACSLINCQPECSIICMFKLHWQFFSTWPFWLM
jgi:hypothetical protein